MNLRIRRLRAFEILDSRGSPTLAVEAELSNSVTAAAQVPSGASTGGHEALELRDGDAGRYGGKGVRRAVANVESVLSEAVSGLDAEDSEALDTRMIALDGTPDKSKLGANAMLGVSCAVARAVAMSRNLPLWQSLLQAQTPRLPVPMVNIFSGGLHAGRQIEFQDFLVVPHGFSTFALALEAIVKVHCTARQVLEERNYVLTGVADEGGWGPRLETNQLAIELLTEAIERSGFRPGDEMSIALDAATTHFYRDGHYQLSSENRNLSTAEMIELLWGWCDLYPISSIEDGLAEDDWEGWRQLTQTLGDGVRLIGDDLFATNPARLARGVREGAANAVLIKMNQIGTLTETFRVAKMAQSAGFHTVVSARSGETEDAFLADLAVAAGADQIKIGSITRSERLAKYNRLLEIEAKYRLPYGPL